MSQIFSTPIIIPETGGIYLIAQATHLVDQLLESDEEGDISDEELRYQEKKQRCSCRKRDPKQSNWYIEYVLNERGTFSDPRHRDDKKCRNRFVIGMY